MKIAYQHIIDGLEEIPSIVDLSEKLFQLGHEHEIDNDVFDFEFTPNRGDCLSLKGIIRDLKVFYKIKESPSIYKDNIPKMNMSFTNLCKESCPSICFLRIKIKDQKIEYKDYLNRYFDDLNIKKNNFFTDISNYIAYEQGQPIHAYDFKLIDGNLTLKNSQNSKEKFITLLNDEIKIEDHDLVFFDKKGPINLAGIMGGLRTSCSQNTNDALIECAYFKPEFILGRSVKYGLNSEASHKFERGVDPLLQEEALRRFIQIVEDHIEIEHLEIYRDISLDKEINYVDCDVDMINKILGTKIEKNYYESILVKLGFKIDESKVVIPSYRSDIFHQNDLAEEIARVIGYDNIEQEIIKIHNPKKISSTLEEDKIKTFLIENGFCEVINMPFNSNEANYSIKVDNPLDSKRKFLRTQLLPSLVENVVYNEKRQKESLKFFEISDIYFLKNNNVHHEKKLGIIISGRQGLGYKDFSKKLDKKYLKELFKKIGADVEEYVQDISRDNIDSKIKTPIIGFEVNLNDIYSQVSHLDYSKIIKNNFLKYHDVSDYPSSYRDFSFSIEDEGDIYELYKCIEESEIKFLKDFFMFDYYEDKKNNKIKIGYRFIFQSNKKTLTDEEINKSVKNLIEPILSINSLTIPGL